ncbi:MAG: hypothetical protein Q8M56_14920 [Desulfobacterales bacterium]|nr:hypothetical protein [Desulfobacterales bacterium]
MACGADYRIDSFVDSMSDGFDDALADIRCDRL